MRELIRLVPPFEPGAEEQPTLPFVDPPARIPHGRTMENLMGMARRIVSTEAAVLITGESGVGKEHLARFIHAGSARARGPFVPVNCGALPDTLFESELFGHARGAFTGAVQDRPGLFETAERGTLLLDEVGEVPLPLQVKLLRALQDHEIRRVGENRQRKFDVRVIAATNRDLAQDVGAGRFRKDLFYRLNVVGLSIPPLRDRPEDLRGLAGTILARIAAQMKRPIAGYSPDALEQILRYPWPGNIRELENAIERACALATGAPFFERGAQLVECFGRDLLEFVGVHGHNTWQLVQAPRRYLFTFTSRAGAVKMEERIEGSAMRAFARVPDSKPTIAVLRAAVGTYYSAELDVRWTIVLRDGKLVLTRHRMPDAALAPVSGEVFQVEDFLVLTFIGKRGGPYSTLDVTTERARHVRFERE